ncbi:MAG: COX15/CtaA family protein, partial [Verrucomicrobiota bacterium]
HGLLPPAHNAYVDINFTHTRFMALLVAVHVILLWLRVRRSAASESRLMSPAWLLLALLVTQVGLGISIIWTYRNPWPTTLHVINGAALLATSLLIALRASILTSAPEVGAVSSYTDQANDSKADGGALHLTPLATEPLALQVQPGINS